MTRIVKLSTDTELPANKIAEFGIIAGTANVRILMDSGKEHIHCCDHDEEAHAFAQGVRDAITAGPRPSLFTFPGGTTITTAQIKTMDVEEVAGEKEPTYAVVVATDDGIFRFHCLYEETARSVLGRFVTAWRQTGTVEDVVPVAMLKTPDGYAFWRIKRDA